MSAETRDETRTLETAFTRYAGGGVMAPERARAFFRGDADAWAYARMREKQLVIEPETAWCGVLALYFMRLDIPRRTRCPIKIGVSVFPERRRAAIATGSPYPVTILATLPDALLGEGCLHHAFRRARLNGEWFRPVPELLTLIEAVQTCARVQLARWNPQGVERAKLERKVFGRNVPLPAAAPRVGGHFLMDQALPEACYA